MIPMTITTIIAVRPPSLSRIDQASLGSVGRELRGVVSQRAPGVLRREHREVPVETLLVADDSAGRLEQRFRHPSGHEQHEPASDRDDREPAAEHACNDPTRNGDEDADQDRSAVELGRRRDGQSDRVVLLLVEAERGVLVGQEEEVTLDSDVPPQHPRDELTEGAVQPTGEQRDEPGRHDGKEGDDVQEDEDDQLGNHHDQPDGARQPVAR